MVANVGKGSEKDKAKDNRFHFGVRCPNCKTTIMSLTVHSFVTCVCGETSVDGGRDYFKVCAKEPTKIKTFCVKIK